MRVHFSMWVPQTETNGTHTLQWRHNEHDGISNHQHLECLFNRLFRHTTKKTSKLRVTGLCEGNSPGTGDFPAQRASNAENVFIWGRHHAWKDSEWSDSGSTYWPAVLDVPSRPSCIQHEGQLKTLLNYVWHLWAATDHGPFCVCAKLMRDDVTM